jgi:hypothetical protein
MHLLLEKLLVVLVQGKTVLIVGALATGVVVTGTVGGTAVNLVIAPLVAPAVTAGLVLHLDSPRLGEDVRMSPSLTTSGAMKLYKVSGYALDRESDDGAGVTTVELYMDDAKLGTATLGLSSPDVAAEFRKDADDLRFDESRWEFAWDVAALSRGSHKLRVVARAASDEGQSIRVDVEVGDPLVGFLKPESGNKVNGSVELAGWALDRYTPTGTASGPQIEKVELLLDGSALGNATLGIETPKDVDDRYGVASAGWSYTWDASAIAVGEHALTARAHSSAQPGSWTETSVLVLVEAPKVEGNGCGWLVGTARGEAVATLQAGWTKFHTTTQGYRSKMETVQKTKREEFSAAVDVTKAWLETRRNVALAALHAKADEYQALCLAGQLPSPVTVTYPQDVISTAHLLYEYRSIVDEAMVDMNEYFATRKPVLEAY